MQAKSNRSAAKAGSNVYTFLLLATLLFLITSCILLWLFLGTYSQTAALPQLPAISSPLLSLINDPGLAKGSVELLL
ncbi:MAG: hypothetical protein MPJ24_08155 [Pirellulaceae bacterium]|nr:hypothetical protein [Pirellulaceae bacterium]